MIILLTTQNCIITLCSLCNYISCNLILRLLLGILFVEFQGVFVKVYCIHLKPYVNLNIMCIVPTEAIHSVNRRESYNTHYVSR